MRRPALVSLAALWLVTAPLAAPPPPAVTNVIVITMDGLRWQELFGRAARTLFGQDEKADRRPAGKGKCHLFQRASGPISG